MAYGISSQEQRAGNQNFGNTMINTVQAQRDRAAQAQQQALQQDMQRQQLQEQMRQANQSNTVQQQQLAEAQRQYNLSDQLNRQKLMEQQNQFKGTAELDMWKQKMNDLQKYYDRRTQASIAVGGKKQGGGKIIGAFDSKGNNWTSKKGRESLARQQTIKNTPTTPPRPSAFGGTIAQGRIA